MQELKESMEFFKTAAECWSQIIETQINLHYATMRLILSCDRDMRALEHNQNIARNRIDRIEKSLYSEGIQ